MKNKKLDILFDKWENIPEYKGKFCRDGIINEELYNLAKPKVLFFGKEPNSPDQNAWDYRNWWNEDVYYGFTYRIAERAYGILHDFPPYDAVWKEVPAAHQALKSIAFMNIKKSGGKGTSSYEEMATFAQRDYERLHEQIEIIKPEIIVCGFTWPELRDTIFPNLQWIDSGYDLKIGRFNQARIIDFYHPSSRNAPAAAYSLLQNIVKSQVFTNM